MLELLKQKNTDIEIFSVESEEFKKEEFGTVHLSKINGDFEFKNVNFSYDKKKVLKDIEGISFCEFSEKDVVRHPLVQKIIKAYEKYDTEQEKKRRHDRNSDREHSTRGRDR